MLINPFCAILGFPSQSRNFFPNPSCMELCSFPKKFPNSSPSFFDISAVSCLRDFPKSRSPFVPDLKLSIYIPKSYFRSFFLLLDVLKLLYKKIYSYYFHRNFSTIFTTKLPVNEQVIHLFLGIYPPKCWIRTANSMQILISLLLFALKPI